MRAAAAARALTAEGCSSLGIFHRTGLLAGLKAAAGGQSRRWLLASLASSLDPGSAGLVAGWVPSGSGRKEVLMTLKLYAVVLELVRALAPYLPVLRSRSAALGDQLERSLVSIPLNVAEGAYSRGKNRQARYQSAAASAREALACFETAEALGWVEPLPADIGALFDRVIGTLVRLVQPKH